MYTMPEIYGTRDYSCIVSDDVVAACVELTTLPDLPSCDADIRDLCLIIMEENELNFSSNPEDATELYLNLRRKILDLL